MAGVVLCCALALAVTKTFLVLDALHQIGGGSGVVARVTHPIRHAPATRHTIVSPRRRPLGPSSASASKTVRSLHRRLLSMHVTSSLIQGAGAAKYLWPVSDTSCIVTTRIMLVSATLYQASLVLFLLAKVHVTNGSRALTCWEKGVVCWSRLYAVMYLPLVALKIGIAFATSANLEGTFCVNTPPQDMASSKLSFYDMSESVRVIGVSNALLIAQFFLLLGLFVKPMLASVDGAQSGGLVYRRVVLRNVICTVGIVISYAINSVVIIVTILRDSSSGDKYYQVRAATIGVNAFATLCLTEITLPLGFTSCFAACRKAASDVDSANTAAVGGRTTKPGIPVARATTNTKIVPVQAPLPTETP